MAQPSGVGAAWCGLVWPWTFMARAAARIPGTVGRLVRGRQWRVLFRPSDLRRACFADFWAEAGPGVRLDAEARVLALLEGRTSRGRVTGEPVRPGIAGTVVEIGAGSGCWVDVFADGQLVRRDASGGWGPESSGVSADDGAGAGLLARREGARTGRGPVKRVYGVEPNRDQHAQLRRKVREAGLETVYEIVPVGIEHLGDPDKWEGRIEKESVDCIVSILCLCSVPEPRDMFRELYGYLRKGGRWYVYEHVRVEVNWGMRIYQAFLNLFWPHFLGGCQLCRPTDTWLREAGPWQDMDVGQPPDEQWHHPLPHILAVFTK